MGAKSWFISYSDGNPKEILKSIPQNDRIEAIALATRLFPNEQLVDEGDCSMEILNPPDNQIYVGCFPGLSVIAAVDFAIDSPSQIDPRFLDEYLERKVILHAMHSVVDWFAYAVWEKKNLVRSLSLSPDSGIAEDIGDKQAFENPYWSGEHPLCAGGEDLDYPFKFHPLELAEAAMLEYYGFQFEGLADASLYEPDEIQLVRLRRKKIAKVTRAKDDNGNIKPWWKFW